MDISQVRRILGWSTVVNFVLLIFVAVIFIVAKEWIYGIWSIFYTLSYEAYDIIMISALAIWKILMYVFFLIPYVAIRIIEYRE